MVYCSVQGCKTTQKNAKEQGIQMFRFPRDPAFIRLWIYACQKPWTMNTVTARICSLHFTPDSFHKPLIHTLLNYTPKAYRSLKPDAVPTENLPLSTKPTRCSKDVSKCSEIDRRRDKQHACPESPVHAVVIKIEEDTIANEIDNYSGVEVRDDNYAINNSVFTEHGDDASGSVISDVVPNETVTSAADETSFATQDSNREQGSIEKPLTKSDAKWKTEVGMLCRLCSKSDFNCIPIFRGKGETLELGTKIPKYLQIEVQPGDKLPDQVCPMCLEAICAWDEYVKSCITADKKLKELLLDENEMPAVLKQNKKSSAPGQKLLVVNMQNLVTVKQNVALRESTAVDQPTSARKKNMCSKNAVGTKKSKINISTEKVRNKLVKDSASINVTQNRNSGNETEHTESDDVFQDDFVDDENIGEASGNNKEDDNWLKEGQFKGEKVYKCGVCSTPFFNYLQCVAHKMAAHPKSILEEESEMSDSNIEESPNLQDINVSVNKNNHKENSTDPLRENANKENCNPEGSSNFKCSVCATDFSSYISLAAHKMAAHASHKCNVCFQIFPSSRALIKHAVVKHKSISERMEPKTCPVCSQQIEGCNWNKHVRSHPGLCAKCYKIIPNEKEFEEHKFFHVKNYKCHTCGKAFKTSTILKYHSETHLPDSVAKRFKCPKCDVAFRWEASVKRHYEVNHATNVNSVLCHICCKTFSCERYFKVHMRQVHPSASPLQCEVCGKFFKLKKYLIQHMVCHLPSNKKPVIRTSKDRTYDVKCEKCGRLFASKTGLTLHSRKDCTSTESRMCYICGLILGTSLEFQKHRIKHKSRPFQCTYCDRSFSTENAKITHTYKHTGERPYVCVVCDKRFLSKYHLLLHSTMHSSSKPFECHFCDKTFRHKINLSQHVRSHTNDRRYKCDMCSRAFIHQSHLKMHKRKHYKTLPCFDTSSER